MELIEYIGLPYNAQKFIDARCIIQDNRESVEWILYFFIQELSFFTLWESIKIINIFKK